MSTPLDEGPFFHGTVADLTVGDLLTAGHRSNYRSDVVMNHIYFTARADGAGLAAEIAAELAGGAATRCVFRGEITEWGTCGSGQVTGPTPWLLSTLMTSSGSSGVMTGLTRRPVSMTRPVSSMNRQ